MDYKNIFENKEDQGVFIKVTAKPHMDSSQKAALNRMGNNRFNSGDIEGARRIYLTTGYTDGLVRVGDHYKSQGRMLDALRMYWIAPDRSKAEPIITQLSAIIHNMLEGELNATGKIHRSLPEGE